VLHYAWYSAKSRVTDSTMGTDLSRKLMLLIVSMAILTVMVGCMPSPKSTPTLAPSPQNQQPIEIISVFGALQPINSVGPVVEITLKNVAVEPVVSLAATLELSGSFNFVFNVTSSNPLLPDKSISAKRILIGGGFSDSISYPLTINGTLQNGATFAYTKQVQIVEPPNK
jgi:hypothetical protein